MVADGMDGVNFTSVLLPILLASGRCPALQLQPYMTHSMPLKENTNKIILHKALFFESLTLLH